MKTTKGQNISVVPRQAQKLLFQADFSCCCRGNALTSPRKNVSKSIRAERRCQNRTEQNKNREERSDHCCTGSLLDFQDGFLPSHDLFMNLFRAFFRWNAAKMCSRFPFRSTDALQLTGPEHSQHTDTEKSNMFWTQTLQIHFMFLSQTVCKRNKPEKTAESLRCRTWGAAEKLPPPPRLCSGQHRLVKHLI